MEETRTIDRECIEKDNGETSMKEKQRNERQLNNKIEKRTQKKLT